MTLPAGDVRKISRFRNEVAHRAFSAAYERALAAWPIPPTPRDVETRYGATHVHCCGASSGTPIVLLHAVAMSSPAWFGVVAALGEHHPVYALDTITDAGRSAPTSPLRDGNDLANWLDDALVALDVDRAHLIGLSFGGWIALNQARLAPSRLASVTAVDPPGAIGRPRGWAMLKMLPDGVLAKAKSERALHRLLRRLNNGEPVQQPLLDLCVAGLRTFRLKQPFPKRMRDTDLAAIRTPTLLLFGEASPVNHAAQAARRARRLLPYVQSEVVPDAGHMLTVENPELFERRVLVFIDGVDRAVPRSQA